MGHLISGLEHYCCPDFRGVFEDGLVEFVVGGVKGVDALVCFGIDGVG